MNLIAVIEFFFIFTIILIFILIFISILISISVIFSFILILFPSFTFFYFFSYAPFKQESRETIISTDFSNTRNWHSIKHFSHFFLGPFFIILCVLFTFRFWEIKDYTDRAELDIWLSIYATKKYWRFGGIRIIWRLFKGIFLFFLWIFFLYALSKQFTVRSLPESGIIGKNFFLNNRIFLSLTRPTFLKLIKLKYYVLFTRSHFYYYFPHIFICFVFFFSIFSFSFIIFYLLLSIFLFYFFSLGAVVAIAATILIIISTIGLLLLRASNSAFIRYVSQNAAYAGIIIIKKVAKIKIEIGLTMLIFLFLPVIYNLTQSIFCKYFFCLFLCSFSLASFHLS